MKSLFLFLLLSCAFSSTIFAQGTSINKSGTPPDASAILDVQSDTKGVLIPRVTTIQRGLIPLPANGLVVFDTDTGTFWYRLGIKWVELVDNFHGLRDTDRDTKVQVEESPDEDIIRFDIEGVEAMVLDETTQGATRLDIGPDTCLIIGYKAGLSSVAGLNTILGFESGQNNTTGKRNVFLGYRAGKNNGANQNNNVLIGTEAGVNNNASNNTLIGYQSGLANTSGTGNTFLGYGSGHENTTGNNNTFLGHLAGHDNRSIGDNTMIGFSAGYYNTGNLNTFVGKMAGFANHSGLFNTVVGAEAAGNSLANHNMGNGNAILGYQAGYGSDSIWFNTLVGYRAGYDMTFGFSNVLLGYQAGLSLTTGHSNVGIGINSLRANLTGNHNVAVGDSTLYNNTTNGNVAMGSKAGMANTTGASNTFVGKSAGLSNLTGGFNVMMGSSAGQGNKTGGHNVFIGSESAYSNVGGEFNNFIGYASGFRNTSGSKNIFLGNRTAEFNINGNSNIGIGTSALTRNNNGSFNIAIGDQALGDPVSEGTSITGNIGIGKNAGRSIVGNQNIIIGNESGIAMDGMDNVLLGNNIQHYGTQNTYLGTNTSAGIVQSPVKATAVGYGTTILQDYSVILGDASNYQTKVGIGTNTPSAWLHIEGQGFEALKVTQNGTNALRVLTNGKVVASHELLVNTTSGKPGYQVSVDGNIACEELLVQDSGAWPDYVFADDYTLMPISDLHSYLKEKQHLPGIPSASEVAVDGVKVADMTKRLLEKIEELTLYVIEMESRLKELESK